MAASMVIEEERGTSTGWRHPHNGYYAGDLSRTQSDTQGGGDRPQIRGGVQTAGRIVLAEAAVAHLW